MAQAAKNEISLSPSERAAIIISILGEDGARPIVEKLDDAALSKITSSLTQISLLPRQALQEVVMEFLKELRSTSGVVLGGKAQTRELISSVVESRQFTFATVNGTDDAAYLTGDLASSWETDESVWSRLEKSDPKNVADYLSRLTPNLISLILRKLDVTFSSDILCLIDEEKLNPVIGYMVETSPDDPGIESILSRMVEIEFLNVQQNEDEGDAEALGVVGELLSLIPQGKREALMAFLSSQHESRLGSIQKSLFTLDSLPDVLPRAAVPVVMRNLDAPEIVKLIASLQSTYPEVTEFLLSNISSRLAGQIKEDLADAAAISDEESEKVQREFLTLLMSLKREGIITINQSKEEAV